MPSRSNSRGSPQIARQPPGQIKPKRNPARRVEREQAQLRSALEKEAKAKAAKGAVAAAAKAVASDAPAPVIRGVPKALVMKGVPKALGGGGGSANAATKEKIHAVADGKVGKLAITAAQTSSRTSPIIVSASSGAMTSADRTSTSERAVCIGGH